MRKIIASCAAAAAAALALALAVAPAGASNASRLTYTSGPNYSSSLAGYAAVAKSGSTVTGFKYVSAEFTVPSLNCGTTANGEVGQYVAFGTASGQPDLSSELGIQEECQSGTPVYPAMSFGCCQVVPINPGDLVQVSLSITVHHHIYADYTNLTTGITNQNLLGCCYQGFPSAWVFTAEDSGPPIADFTQIGFRQVQVEGISQSLMQPLASSAWTVAEYALKGPSGSVDAKPEALLSGKYTSAFANDWLSPN
jgi:hypothetical protein